MVVVRLVRIAQRRPLRIALAVSPGKQPSHREQVQGDHKVQDHNRDFCRQVSGRIFRLERLWRDDVADSVSDGTDAGDCDFLSS